MACINSVVWLVEAWSNSDRSDVQYGSAVMVVCAKGEERPKKYFLTCSHVIRKTAPGGPVNYGEKHKHIIVWRPGESYALYENYKGPPEERFNFVDVPLFAPLDTNWHVEESPTRDWVLLEFKDEAIVGRYHGANAVFRWGKPQPDDNRMSVVGYPGGGKRFDERTPISSLQVDEYKMVTGPLAGMLYLTGNGEARKGMSGGGVFNAAQEFVGLHRERFDAGLEHRSVLAGHIRDELLGQKVEVIVGYLAGEKTQLEAHERVVLVGLLVKHFANPAMLPEDFRTIAGRRDEWPAKMSQEFCQQLIEKFPTSEGRKLAAVSLLACIHESSVYTESARDLLSNFEHEAIELSRILRPDEPEVSKLASIYKELVGPEWKTYSDFPATISRLSLAICSAQEAGSQKACLSKFIQRAGAIWTELRAPLNDWWTRTAPKLGLEMAPEDPADAGPLPESTARLSVLIDVTPSLGANTGGLGTAKWKVSVSLYSHADKKYEPLSDQATLDDAENLPALLESIWTELIVNRQIDQEQIFFEFFLPKEWIWKAVDTFPVSIEDVPSTLGFETPVLLRIGNRSGRTRRRIQERWKGLVGVRASEIGEILVESNGDGVSYTAFENEKKLLCLVLSQPFASPDQLACMKCLEAAIAAGLPVAIWTRDGTSADTLVADLRKDFAGVIRQLPARIHDLRKRCDAKIGLLYESDAYWPPDNSKLPSIMQ